MIAPLILIASGIAGYLGGKNKISKREKFVDTYIDAMPEQENPPMTQNGVTVWPIEGDYSKLVLSRPISMTARQMGRDFSSYLYGMHLIPQDLYMLNDDAVLDKEFTFVINFTSLNYNEKTRKHLFTLFAKANKINYHEFRAGLGLKYIVNADFDANSLTYQQQYKNADLNLIPVYKFAQRILIYSSATPEMIKEKSQIQERIDKIWNTTFTLDEIQKGAETWRYKNRGMYANFEEAKKALFKEAHRQLQSVTNYLKYTAYKYPDLSDVIKSATSQPGVTIDTTTQTNK